MGKGVDGCAIFIDDRDRYAFLNALERIRQQTNSTVLAYCLMGNHFHLAIKVDSVPLSRIMHRLLTGHALTFNPRHDREGHLFQARYRAKLCTDDAYLTALIRYIHMNPVRAGLTTRPEDWPWSSYRAYCASGKDGLLPLQSDIPDFDPWKSESAVMPKALLRSDTSDMPIKTISESISKKTGIEIAEIRSGSKRRIVVNAKRLIVSEAIGHGHTLTSVAAWLGVTRGTVTHYLREKQSTKLSA